MNSRIEHQDRDQPGAPSEELTILDDRYALDFPLTYAASGTAWLATDTFSAGAKRVVVKYLSRLDQADADELVLLRTRFTPAQLQAARALPRIEDLGGFEAEPYIVFARTDGQTLDQYLRSGADGSAIPMVALLQFAKAVQAMHAAGVLHLDIAPAHLTYDPAGDAVRLLDWGHALPIDSPAPTLAPGAEAGIYAGPGMFGEVEPQPRDDVYATACVIYELLTGQHPYDECTAAEAAAMQLVPAPIATLNADQNAVVARALNVTGEQPAIEMAQLIAVFEGRERGVAAAAPRALEQTPGAASALPPRYLSVPVAPASLPAVSSAPRRSEPPANTSPAKPSSANVAPGGVSAPPVMRPAAPLTEQDALAARTASIEAMIAREASSRAQPPGGPEPELVEPSIAHELVSPDDTMPPRTPPLSEEETRLAIPPASPAFREAAQNAVTGESRRDPFITSASLPPIAHGPQSQPPRTHAPFSRPPASQPPRSQSPFSQPPLSQQPLSQPPLSQPPLAERARAPAPTRSAGPRSRPLEADVAQVLRGTEFDRTRPNLLSQPRGWAVSLPLGLTITLASCVIGVVAGMWLAGSGSSGKRAAATAPNAAPVGGEAARASASPAPAGADAKPAAVALPRGEAAATKPPAESTPTAPPLAPPNTAVPQAAPTPKPAPPVATSTPTVAPTVAPAPKPVAPPVAAPPKPAAPPPVAVAPRPAVAPKPAAPVANVPGAAPAPVGVDLLDATMATRALTERVARETEEELARQRGAKQ